MAPPEDDCPTVGPYAHAEGPWALTRVAGGRVMAKLRAIYVVGVVAFVLAWPAFVVEPPLSFPLMLAGWLGMIVGGLQAASRRGMERFLLVGPRHVHVERVGAGQQEDTLVIDRRRWPVTSVRDVVVRSVVVLGGPGAFVAYLLLPGLVIELHAAPQRDEVVAVATAVRRGLGLEPPQPAPAIRQPQMLGGGLAIMLLLVLEVAVLLAVTVGLMLDEVDWRLAGAGVLGFIAVDRLVQEGIRWVTSRNARNYLARELPAAFDGPTPPPQGEALLRVWVVLAVLGTVVEIVALIMALVA